MAARVSRAALGILTPRSRFCHGLFGLIFFKPGSRRPRLRFRDCNANKEGSSFRFFLRSLREKTGDGTVQSLFNLVLLKLMEYFPGPTSSLVDAIVFINRCVESRAMLEPNNDSEATFDNPDFTDDQVFRIAVISASVSANTISAKSLNSSSS